MRPVLQLVESKPNFDQAAKEAALEAAILKGLYARHILVDHPLGTAKGEISKVQAFRAFVGRPPWLWRKTDLADYGVVLVEKGYARESRRAKLGAVKRYLDYGRDPGNEFDEQCFELTGRHIPQICTRDNMIRHGQNKGTSKRRNAKDDELTRLFEAIERAIITAKRPCDRLARKMHYALMAMFVAFAPRAHEAQMADQTDLNAAVTPDIAEYSQFEDLRIRFGKRHDGSEYPQRSIVATYPFRHCLEILDWYIERIRPQLERADSDDALFLGIRGERLRSDSMSAIFKQYRDLAKLSKDLTLHCMRHTFQTKLHELGMEVAVSSKLLGHERDATTLIYDHIGSEFVKERVLANKRKLVEKSKRCRPSNGVCAA